MNVSKKQLNLVKRKFTFQPHELSILQEAALCLSRLHQCREEIDHIGLLVTDTRGSVKKNPLLEVEANNNKMFLDYCSKLKILDDGKGAIKK